ncbi:type 1 membrane protein [Artemisia annua]|uniref:Type 1 membrane protein n=1 Tax=Artemisia annua TaxID=35608 RepID=A0A2U1PVP5_ARTAN|nr:type 1 membrane protein [Artemisia annua]
MANYHLIFLIIISSIFCLQSTADGSGSVYFLDSSINNYFHSPSSSQSKSMSLPEVGAAISVLLGFAPPSTLSSESSEKLNEVLTANPFNRPHAVFLLEINGFGDKLPDLGSDSDIFSSALKNEVVIEDAEIQLSDEDELSLVSLNDPLSADMEFTDQDLTNFASWLDGSYVTASEPLTGELTVSLANDVQLELHMSKKADREFIRSIIYLIHNVQRAVQLHEDLPESTPAELIKGQFDGFKAFQEHYGTNDIVQKGAELLVTSVSKIYDSLQARYKGQIVGVVTFNGSPAKESDTVLPVKFTTRPSSRMLEEVEGSHDAAILIVEVLLVRRTLAWITGIILLISTLMGTWFLLYMPITKDTLLYSNVKLD